MVPMTHLLFISEFFLVEQVIGHARSPRSLRRVNTRELGVDYFWNKKAWQQESTFLNWIHSFVVQVMRHRLECQWIGKTYPLSTG